MGFSFFQEYYIGHEKSFEIFYNCLLNAGFNFKDLPLELGKYDLWICFNFFW